MPARATKSPPALVNRRVLAVLAFLSRSGLEPTVSALRCEQGQYKGPGAGLSGDRVDISAINGIPIAGHQGPGTITDLTIRTLLTLPGEFVPQQIVSLMRYPGSSSTHADAAYWNHIHVEFRAAPADDHAQPCCGRDGSALGSHGRDRPLAAGAHEHAERDPVEPADGTGGGAAGADRRHQAELSGVPDPKQALRSAASKRP